MTDRILTATENALAAIPFAVVAVIAFVNVVTRYFFNVSLAFTTELTVNLVVWTVMIGSVIGIREGAHLGFTMLRDRVTGRARDGLTVLVTLATVAFLLALLVHGTEMAAQQFERGRATPSIGVPQWLFTAALPVGAALGVHRAVRAGVAALRRTDRPAAPLGPVADR
ncbi:TRAP transporter small permease [Pseudonocardia nematodicida]|uniref:TRAP transporter small permease n=1 Tax=Pseudonocardia nematodicida TaxID=1206997 RepID=A0ABV1KGY3_9PSEU